MGKSQLLKENARLVAENAKLVAENTILKEENAYLRKRVSELVQLCLEKDKYFKQMISEGLRYGIPLAGKHMADLKHAMNIH